MKKFGILVSLTLALAMILGACSAAPNTATPTTSAGTTTTQSAAIPAATTAATVSSAATTEAPTAMASTSVAATAAPLNTETSTAVMTTPSPLATETAAATVAPTSTTTTGTGVLPNTGSTGADRLSHMLQYPVIGQSGQEVAKVADVVVDLGTSMVTYVVIQPNAAMKMGSVYIPVPYSAMTVRAYEGAPAAPEGTAMPMSTSTAMTGTSSTSASTGMKATATASMGLNTRNLAFYLNIDDNTLKNAPHFTGLPAVSASSWDKTMSNYWSKTSSGSVVPASTATAMTTSAASTSVAATETPMAVAGASSVTATATTKASTAGTAALGMKGNIYGSSLLTYRINDTAAANVAKVSDGVVDLASGRVMYLILSGGTTLGTGNKVVLVPLQIFRNTPGATNFTLKVPTSVVAKAPLFNLNELPDFSANNWDSQVSSYWQSNMGTK